VPFITTSPLVGLSMPLIIFIMGFAAAGLADDGYKLAAVSI